ncbi:GNAT family N-acetyltransferase [Pseudoalteromonas denitrificans]|uniref:Acetyltransferase (GNAT) domain-containing protein n=1 Tax=Pseudoalteromonas denitrificans DSM 6059 TaxID=1123010 RepID=A0A1I1SR27_9GAMM|nr:GNAT family N-acetyltransferase [Pseudoalteromonas denitrificans]SFD48925.1 Acetyltransferase (GNAT) domain-containing protein [Pseudoalteromonas denitrificans DSM 6059]
MTMNNNPLNNTQLNKPLHQGLFEHKKSTHIQIKLNSSRLLKNLNKLQLKPLKSTCPEKTLSLLTADICKKLAINNVSNLEQANSFIQGINTSHTTRFAIFHPENGFVGCICFGITQEVSERYANISYFIGEQYQQQGFASQALDLLFEELRKLNITYVTAQVYRYNIGSKRLLIKAGFYLLKDDISNNHLEKQDSDILNFKRFL